MRYHRCKLAQALLKRVMVEGEQEERDRPRRKRWATTINAESSVQIFMHIMRLLHPGCQLTASLMLVGFV